MPSLPFTNQSTDVIYQHLLLFAFLLVALPSRAQLITAQERANHLQSINEPAGWDSTMLSEDLEYAEFFDDVGPLRIGVFPVPNYELLSGDGFDGVFSTSSVFQPDTINNKQVVYQAFGSGNNRFQQPHLAGQDNQVFFTVITTTDTVDAVNYTTANSVALSRNHPDICGQGQIFRKNSRLDFVAFWTAEGQRFAIVNMRLFDLNQGDIILIAPQPNGSLRSWQLKSPPLTKDALGPYLRKEILTRKEVIAFLTE